MEQIGNMIRDGIKPDLTAYTSIEAIKEARKNHRQSVCAPWNETPLSP